MLSKNSDSKIEILKFSNKLAKTNFSYKLLDYIVS